MPSISTPERPQVAGPEEPERGEQPLEVTEPIALPAHRSMSGTEGALSAMAFTIGVAAVSFAISLLLSPDGSNANLSVDMLRRGPFDDYFVPGVLLLTVVGGSTLLACGLVLATHKWAWQVSLAAGAVLVTWVSARVSIMGYGSQMEPIVFIAGVAMAVMAPRLRKATRVG